jgi:hypothetical protein
MPDYHQFSSEHPGIDVGEFPHVVVIYYGTGTFYFPISKRSNAYLGECFAYESGLTWRTLYYRFKGDTLMQRLCDHRNGQA